MKLLVLLLGLFNCNFSQSQNLVPNPGFEVVTDCNALGSGIAYRIAPPWNSPDFRGTADLYNTCSLNPDSWSVPQTGRGFQFPHSGNGYAGAVFYSTVQTFREYLQVKLDSDLIANQTYDVSYYVSLASSKSYFASNNFGLYFSKSEIQTDSLLSLHLVPQILEKKIITDTSNWTLIGGKFIAQGGERYIIIGNFFDDNNTNAYSPTPLTVAASYYFIDDVSVQKAPTLCNIDFNMQINSSFNYIRISGPSCKTRVRIYNVLGQVLYETDFTYSTDIDMAHFPAGIYFVECLNGKQRMSKKFLKGK